MVSLDLYFMTIVSYSYIWNGWNPPDYPLIMLSARTFPLVYAAIAHLTVMEKNRLVSGQYARSVERHGHLIPCFEHCEMSPFLTIITKKSV